MNAPRNILHLKLVRFGLSAGELYWTPDDLVIPDNLRMLPSALAKSIQQFTSYIQSRING